MPGEDDEPYFEQIGGGLIDDRARHSSGGASGWQRSDDDPGPHRGRDGSLNVLQALRQHAAGLRSLPTWLGILAAVALPGVLTVGLASWAAAERWDEGDFSAASHLSLAALLVVSASAYGTAVGFRGMRASGGRLAWAAWGSAVRAAAFAVVAGLLLAAVGIATGGSLTMTGVSVVVMVLEVLIFATLGAGAAALAGTRVIGATLAGVMAALLLIGNIAATILLAPIVWTSERTSLPVNVERDKAGRLVYYECVGNQFRVETVAHTERVAWIAASHPAVVFSSLAAGTVTLETGPGWMLQIPQRAMDGPAAEVPCINGMGSEEFPPPLHAGLVGIAGQLAVAAVVLLPGRWLSRRRQGVVPWPG